MTLETSPTKFVENGGVKFAFRELGSKAKTPIVCLQHFSGTMDSWDPAVINALAENHKVIVFNNKGIGRTGGKTPNSVAEMAADAIGFIKALGITKVNLLGFSLGGMAAQLIAAENPLFVDKLILAGTAPQGGEEHLLQVLQKARVVKDSPDPRLPLFFTESKASQQAGLAFLHRASARTVDRDPDSGDEVTGAQAKALIGWCATQDPSARILAAISQPTLIVSGSDDTMLPISNAYFMFKHISNAQLLLYPDAGHGAIFQYPQRFVSHVDLFLSE
jgi:pimeloyl-ACP methyl ester carboxylesterase